MKDPLSIADNLLNKIRRDKSIRALVYIDGSFTSLPRYRLREAHDKFLVGCYNSKATDTWIAEDINFVLTHGLI